MKKMVLVVLLILATAVAVFAQGKAVRYSDGNGEPLDVISPKEIKKYSQAAGSTKVTIPLASTVSRYCIQPTAASGIRLGTSSGFSGDQKAVAANTELCRGVRNGITQLQYSSATTGTAIVELQY